MPGIKKKKCRHCQVLFIPNPRNKDRQCFCRKPDCRKASKANSQRRWLDKPDNRGERRSGQRGPFMDENQLASIFFPDINKKD